ncbi:unnamed protein product [Prorocentrum cordatum]|uniref:Uncharacterized protein n=1 Tax=Prorocentrum cordatum TaxID=2364126 RepID=A0ABN9RAT1_9DINO|nr:unnamed protein product [Polarella glacialis]
MEDTRSCRSDDGEQGDDDAGDAWEDDGPRGWVEALGWMKGCEMQRRLSFREWVDSARALLAEQKLQLKSARQLATVVRAHIREQSDAEEEFAKRLAKAAAQRHRAESAMPSQLPPAGASPLLSYDRLAIEVLGGPSRRSHGGSEVRGF